MAFHSLNNNKVFVMYVILQTMQQSVLYDRHVLSKPV